MKSALQIEFLGATSTVTGSRYLLSTAQSRVLVDCGLFQGWKQLRLKNWAPLSFSPTSLDSVLLTHAHIDHSGYLPALCRQGFRRHIWCTRGTRALAELMLIDAAKLQEEEAAFANKHRFTRHRPALPLFTTEDAQAAIHHLRAVDFAHTVAVSKDLTARWRSSGHIIGAASIEVVHQGVTIVFSGDLGRPNDPLLRAPAVIEHADYLVLESTYGDRRHPPDGTLTALRDVVRRTAARGGSVLIPAFAVGRAQTVLYYLYQLQQRGELPPLPIFINSPMAIDATAIYREFSEEHRLSEADYSAMCRLAKFVRTPEESKQLCAQSTPMIVISASGMATGGRVLHHLKAMAPDARNTILFTGFQSGGTRGATLVGGADAVKIHGEYVPVRAEVVNVETMSAHADYEEILGWLVHFKRPPRQVFITHGEPAAADALRQRISERLGWHCTVPEFRDQIALA
uniref:Metallo-beta-lactamase family protein, RNA-specific n=1 Tax=uncultured bacterium A1Q1_fos_504 TaxID=1256580 RepID=L7VW25_9BACT|nr:metallo-beta-lactamase family protein, RNA-specific [uncultured bacterium A1Q1_fos_504]